MTNEEFQKLVLEKLTGLEQGQSKLEQRQSSLEQGQSKLEKRIDEIESTLTAKIDGLDAKAEGYGQIQQDDVKGLLEVMNKKLDRIIATQNIQGETINILALRQLQTESELAALKKAK